MFCTEYTLAYPLSRNTHSVFLMLPNLCFTLLSVGMLGSGGVLWFQPNQD